MIISWHSLSFLFAIGFAGAGILYMLFSRLYASHMQIHQTNDCGMTMMWRKIIMQPVRTRYVGNNFSEYSLSRYHEGGDADISYRERFFRPVIPVLFIPGSSGSCFQVRSMASVMQNKTEMLKLHSTYHFYALDFDEEMSFLSGYVLRRQKVYAKAALRTILELYADAKYPVDEVVIIGHSFGGIIAATLREFSYKGKKPVKLIMTMAAPFEAPPILMDHLVEKFYANMKNLFDQGIDDEEFGIISWSGGVKDTHVPERLSLPSHPVIKSIPTWSLRYVNVDADHLCILWCNQLVRHQTRFLTAYAENLLAMPKLRQSVRHVINNFFENGLEKKDRLVCENRHLKMVRLSFPGRRFAKKFSTTPTENCLSLMVEGPTTQAVYRVNLAWRGSECKGPLHVFFETNTSEILRRDFNIPRESEMTFWLHNTLSIQRPLQGSLSIYANATCEFGVVFNIDLFMTAYMGIINNVPRLITAFIEGSMLTAIHGVQPIFNWDSNIALYLGALIHLIRAVFLRFDFVLNLLICYVYAICFGVSLLIVFPTYNFVMRTFCKQIIPMFLAYLYVLAFPVVCVLSIPYGVIFTMIICIVNIPTYSIFLLASACMVVYGAMGFTRGFDNESQYDLFTTIANFLIEDFYGKFLGMFVSFIVINDNVARYVARHAIPFLSATAAYYILTWHDTSLFYQATISVRWLLIIAILVIKNYEFAPPMHTVTAPTPESPRHPQPRPTTSQWNDRYKRL